MGRELGLEVSKGEFSFIYIVWVFYRRNVTMNHVCNLNIYLTHNKKKDLHALKGRYVH